MAFLGSSFLCILSCVLLWIRYRGILLGESYSGIRALTDFIRDVAKYQQAARLLTGVEYSRVRDSTWMYLTSTVTTRIAVGLFDVQGNYPTTLE